MIARRLHWVCLVLVFAVGACESKQGRKQPEGDRKAPVLSADPEPGSYPVYDLKVRISGEDEELELFYALGEPPVLGGSLSGVGSFSTIITASTQIQVLAVKGKESWGPYTFEYELTGPEIEDGVGGCMVSGLAKYWHDADDSIVFDVTYQFPVSLSKLFLVVDGVDTRLEVDANSATGVASASLGALGEGAHAVACKVTAPGLNDLLGDPVTFAVDTVAPAGGWLDSGGDFARTNWPGYFELQASDSGSGLAAVEACDETHTFCFPAKALGGGVYAYATVLTAQVAGGGTVAARIVDQAGNETLVGGISLSLGNFAEPDPNPVQPITMTTAATIPAEMIDAGGGEICDLSLTSCYASPSSVSLADGWNDFLYRPGGRSEWQSLGVYRAGLRVTLPFTAAEWLIFETGLPPAYQSSLVAITSGTTEWRRDWFDVPHLFFVEDVNANRRWDEYDTVFTAAADDFSEPLMASRSPVVTSLVEFQWAPRPETMTVTVSCPADCDGPGRLYLDGRIWQYGPPVTHVDLGNALNIPITVPMSPDEWCTFYWDENGDGAVGGTEPRSLGRCGGTPALARQKEELAWVAYGSFVTGVPYGGRVERTIKHVSPSGTPLVSRAWPALVETRGEGVLYEPRSGVSNDLPLPGVDARVEFRIGSQVTWYTIPATSPPSYPVAYQVEVLDEGGAAMAALVRAQLDGAESFGVAEPPGLTTIEVPDAESPPNFMAFRDGYLSVSTEATDTVVSLRLLSPAVTGNISGTVLDVHGAPVSGATVRWSAPPYHGETISQADGSYSLPASGGTGSLWVTAHGKYDRSQAYALDVTRTNLAKTLVLPADEELWPYGPHLGYAPAVTGNGVLRAARSAKYYAADVSGSSSFSVDWLGLRRMVDPAGFLPASPGTYGTNIPVTDLPFLQELESRVTCGARFQLVTDYVFVDSTCWRWTGRHGGIEYYFGRLSPSFEFPPVLGIARFNLFVTQAGAVPPDQTLYFHEVLLGQRFAVELDTGAASGYLPFGVYRVTTADGTALLDLKGKEGILSVGEAYPPAASLSIPQ